MATTNELQERHTNALNNIKQLQETEKYLFESLPTMRERGEDAVRQTISQINTTSAIRQNLFTQLGNVYSKQSSSGGGQSYGSADNDDDMTAILKLGEAQLNSKKASLKSSKGDTFNTLRMIQIGNYEYERYTGRKIVMQVIAFTTIILLILNFVSKQPWNPIPPRFYHLIMLLLLVVSGIYLFRKIWDLSQRDNMNYLQYDFGYKGKPDLPSDSGGTPSSRWETNKSGLRKLYAATTGYAQGTFCPA